MHFSFQGKVVIKLAYEAYQEMAEKEMSKLCAQAREKWNLKHIALHHRQVLFYLFNFFFYIAQHIEFYQM